MSFEAHTILRCYFLPDDADECLTALIHQIDSAHTSIRLFMCGFTHRDLMAALFGAHQRGVDVCLLLERSHSLGHTECAVLNSLTQLLPADRVCITTSTQHELMHLMMCVIDGDASWAADPPTSVDSATTAGYPRAIEGSLNWSPSGLRPMNTLNIIVGAEYAASAQQLFTRRWYWAMAHEAAYQLHGSGSSAQAQPVVTPEEPPTRIDGSIPQTTLRANDAGEADHA